jgi:hypothetical protein
MQNIFYSKYCNNKEYYKNIHIVHTGGSHTQHSFVHNNIDFIEKLLNNKEDINKMFSCFSTKDENRETLFPFSIIGQIGYKVKDIIVALFGAKLIQERISYKHIKFPENIENVYWYECGEPDYRPWYALVKLKYKKGYLYGFYVAECCYTGFDVIGDMKLYLSRDIRNLLEYGITDKICKKIYKYITKR